MVQVDLAMSYGFGSGMALAAHRQLRQSRSRVMNRYGMSALLWFALLFVPHAMYLLWQQPAWHTMFVVQEWSQIPPWVAGLYPMGIAALGVADFAVTAHFIQQQRYGLAWLQFALSLVATFTICTYGWDGTGYQRFLYAGTGGEWAEGVSYPISAFFSGEVAATIAWILPAWLVPYLIVMTHWLRQDVGLGA